MLKQTFKQRTPSNSGRGRDVGDRKSHCAGTLLLDMEISYLQIWLMIIIYMNKLLWIDFNQVKFLSTTFVKCIEMSKTKTFGTLQESTTVL